MQHRRNRGAGGWAGCLMAIVLLAVGLAAFWFLFVMGYWTLLFIVAVVGALTAESRRLSRRR